MKKLFSNLFLSYSASVFGFLISVLSARMLGAAEYSWMSFGLAVAGFSVPILNLGNERTFVRDAIAVGHEAGVARIVNTSFTVRVVLTLILAVTLAIASMLFTDSAANAAAMFSISLWASLLGLYPASWYDYLHETRVQNALVLTERTVSFALITILFFLPNAFHVAWIVGTLLVVVRIFSIARQVKSWWKIFGGGAFQWSLPRNIGNVEGVNLRITTALFFNAIATYGNQLLLSDYEDKAELAAYGLIFQLMSLIFIFQGLGLRLISRQVAETCRNNKNILRALLNNSILLASGSSFLALFVWIGAKYLHVILGDPRFALMNNFSLLLCVWIVVVGIGQVVSQYSLALHQDSWYLWLAISGGVVALVLGVMFVPTYGGLAVASILLGVNSLLILAELSRLVFVTKGLQ